MRPRLRELVEGLGHGVLGYAPTQSARDRLRLRERALDADATKHRPAQPRREVEHALDADAGTHGEPEVVRRLDAEVVEKALDVGGHHGRLIRARVVRLVAVSMAAAVEADDAEAGACERLLPPRADPVQPVVRGEPVHQHDRGAAFGTVDLVMQPDAVAVEVHRVPIHYPMPS